VEIFVIPVDGKFIIYRALLQLAFVGNQALVDRVLPLARGGPHVVPDVPEEMLAFLEAIGFLQPDPAPPPAPDPTYCPTTAVLLLTNRCNLRCIYCYAKGGEEAVQDLSLASARLVIDRVCQHAQELGRPHFELTFHGGGEPLRAWKNLQAAVAYARGKNLPCRISLVSNGVWTAGQREWILQNLNGLSLSFDGTAATQDRQRPFISGRGSFKAVMRTIEALDQSGFSYGIRMTATKPWRRRLPEDVRFICEKTGCQAMQVEPAFNTRRGQHQGPTREESQAFIEAFMEAFEIAGQSGRRLTYSGARPGLLTQTFCTAPYGALIANGNGHLVSCYEIASESHKLARMSTVGQAVDAQIAIDEAARRRLLGHLEKKRATCRDCFCYWHCAGDCYTRSFVGEDGSRAGSDPRCHMNREITARILLWYIMAGEGVWRGQEAHPQEAQLMRTF